MGVDVDEPGREHGAVGVELDVTALVDATNLGDQPVADGDIRGVRRESAAVDDRGAAYDEIDRHACARVARAATRSSIP